MTPLYWTGWARTGIANTISLEQTPNAGASIISAEEYPRSTEHPRSLESRLSGERSVEAGEHCDDNISRERDHYLAPR